MIHEMCLILLTSSQSHLIYFFYSNVASLQELWVSILYILLSLLCFPVMQVRNLIHWTFCCYEFVLLYRSIFCADCTSKTATLTGSKKPSRVCDPCYNELNIPVRVSITNILNNVIPGLSFQTLIFVFILFQSYSLNSTNSS